MHYDEYSATDLMTEEEVADQERQEGLAYQDYKISQEQASYLEAIFNQEQIDLEDYITRQVIN
jgi:hypothetical protein